MSINEKIDKILKAIDNGGLGGGEADSSSGGLLIFEGDSRTSHTVQCNMYPNYKNLTINNFYIKGVTQTYDRPGRSDHSSDSLIKSYNPKTGVLTLGKICNSYYQGEPTYDYFRYFLNYKIVIVD